MIIRSNTTVDTYRIQDLSTGNTSTGNLISTIWDAQNIGTGSGIYSGKTGHTLIFKSLNAGNNITLTESSSGVTIASTGGGSTYTAGKGLTLSGTEFQFGGTLSTIASTVTLNAQGPSTQINFQSAGTTLMNINNQSARFGNFATGAGVYLSASKASGSISIVDNRATPTGIEYLNDYSANFTSRSLIDKGYADGNYLNQASNSVNFLQIDVSNNDAGLIQFSQNSLFGNVSRVSVNEDLTQQITSHPIELFYFDSAASNIFAVGADSSSVKMGASNAVYGPLNLAYVSVEMVSGSAYIKLTGLPTTNPNVANALWNDGGTLKISAG